MRGILDTSLLIADEVDVIAGELAISAVSLAELHFGVLCAPDDESRAVRLHRLTAIESRFDALPVDSVVSRHYGRLAAELQQAGRNPRPRNFDLFIAATAMAHDATLYTRELADFAGLEDLLAVRAA